MIKYVLPFMFAFTLVAKAQWSTQVQDQSQKASVTYIFFNGERISDPDYLSKYGLKNSPLRTRPGLFAGAEDLLETHRRQLADPVMDAALRLSLTRPNYRLDYSDTFIKSSVLLHANRPAFLIFGQVYAIPAQMDVGAPKGFRRLSKKTFDTNGGISCTLHLGSNMIDRENAIRAFYGLSAGSYGEISLLNPTTAQQCVQTALQIYLQFVPPEVHGDGSGFEVIFAKRLTDATGFLLWGDSATFDIQDFYLEPKTHDLNKLAQDHFNH
jgi:hypothetical protein